MAGRKLDRATEFQNRLVRQRDADFKRDQKWGTAVKYYDQVAKKNTKFEAWTSPRYYEDNTKLHTEQQTARDKKDNVEKRRQKLQELIKSDEKTYEIELIVKNRDKYLKVDNRKDIPTQILSDINLGLKAAEDRRQRSEAEAKLYHSWRNSNTTVRKYERSCRVKDMKMSWLDQQIEKRIHKEEEEKKSKRFLRERQERMAEEAKLEEELQEETRRKNDLLQIELCKQMEELKLKESASDVLKRKECEVVAKQNLLSELQEKLDREDMVKKQRELALFNLRQYKLKIKQKIADNNEDIAAHERLAREILQSKVAEEFDDSRKKLQVRQALEDFLVLSQEQKQLEKRREEYLSFIFDSEAQQMYQRQQELWKQESHARAGLILDVFGTIRRQIEDNLARNREEQRRLVQEKEKVLELVQRHHSEMERNEEVEAAKRVEYKEELDRQVKENIEKKAVVKDLESERMRKELEGIKCEELRIEKEIERLQKGGVKQPGVYSRRRMFY